MAKKRKYKYGEFNPELPLYIVEYFCTKECNKKGEWVQSLVTQDKEVAENEKIAREKLESAPTRILTFGEKLSQIG